MIDHRIRWLRIGARRAAACALVGGVAAVTLFTGTAWAAPITVNNHSFQSPTVANDVVSMSLVNWVGDVFGASNGRATWNPPGSNSPDNRADGFIDASGNATPLGAAGSNVFTIFGGDASSGATIYQDSATPLAAGTAYTMSVAVGRRANGDASNWTFGLMANNQSISGGQFATSQYLAYASGSAAELTSGRFLDKTLSITLESGNAAIGQRLRVVLSARGGGTASTTSTAYDNVRLFQNEGSMVASTTQPLGTVGVSSGVSLTFAETASFNTVISGAGGVRVNAGTVTLGAVNTYGGDTTIAAGTLRLAAAGSFASSGRIVVGNAGSLGAVLDLTEKTSFSIGAGRTLMGGGTALLGASTALTVSGTFSPGNSPGLFTYDGGSTTLAGTTLLEIWGTTRATSPSHGDDFYDAVNVVNGGLLATGGALVLDFDQNFADSASFLLFDTLTGGSLAGGFGSITITGVNNAYTGLSFTQAGNVWTTGFNTSNQGLRLTQTESSVVLDVIVVPEPGPLSLAGCGVALAGWMIARRSRRR